MTDWLTEAARRPIGERCTSCDGTGDLVNIVGEWCGYCHCPAGVALKDRKPLPEGLIWRDGKPHVICGVCDNWFEWPCGIEEFSPEESNYCGGSPRCCP